MPCAPALRLITEFALGIGTVFGEPAQGAAFNSSISREALRAETMYRVPSFSYARTASLQFRNRKSARA
jgi:hypothetical protein